jgi:hypothetical protein
MTSLISQDQVFGDDRPVHGGMGPEMIPVLFLEDGYRRLVLPHEPHQDVEIGIAVGRVGEGKNALAEVGETGRKHVGSRSL